MNQGGEPVSHRGWQLEILDGLRGLPAGPQLMHSAVAAGEGVTGWFHHRSRYAVTRAVRLEPSNGAIELYIKVYAAPGGLLWFKEKFRGGRAQNVIRISSALQRHGLSSPRLLIAGRHRATGRTMLVSLRAEGQPLPDLLRPTGRPDWLKRKRELLNAVGALVADLHRAGFVHGDLTPYNVFVVPGEPPRFVLLDHDRTRIGLPIGRRRRQLRNLIQLGRFEFAGLTETDRLRVLRAYLGQTTAGRYRATVRRAARMLAARRGVRSQRR